jgi:hypothetical protein
LSALKIHGVIRRCPFNSRWIQARWQHSLAHGSRADRPSFKPVVSEIGGRTKCGEKPTDALLCRDGRTRASISRKLVMAPSPQPLISFVRGLSPCAGNPGHLVGLMALGILSHFAASLLVEYLMLVLKPGAEQQAALMRARISIGRKRPDARKFLCRACPMA